MSSTSSERDKYVAKSKVYSKIYSDKGHRCFCDLYYIEIPTRIARKFDFKGGDCMIWRYYRDKKMAIMTKEEGWK